MKFVSLSADTNFPQLSAVFGYDDGLSATQSFFKTAILTYSVGGGSGNTRAITLSAGNPTFIPSSVQVWNGTAAANFVTFWLTSGTTCNIYANANSLTTANIAVSTVIAYNGLTVTYIAP
jgi:hypothetical protein